MLLYTYARLNHIDYHRHILLISLVIEINIVVYVREDVYLLIYVFHDVDYRVFDEFDDCLY